MAEIIFFGIVLLAGAVVGLSLALAVIGGALDAQVAETPAAVLSGLTWTFAHDEYADLPDACIHWISETMIDCEATDQELNTWGLSWV